MTAYKAIYAEAVDNHGLVSVETARSLGIPPHALAVLAHRGRLEHVSRGLYRLVCPLPFDGEASAFAQAVESVGPNAVLFGESVLALLGLLPSNPAVIHVAVPGRFRRKPPPGVMVRRLAGETPTTLYEGVRSQSVAAAIRSCRGTVMPDRLLAAARKARERGLLLAAEFAEAKKGIAAP